MLIWSLLKLVENVISGPFKVPFWQCRCIQLCIQIFNNALILHSNLIWTLTNLYENAWVSLIFVTKIKQACTNLTIPGPILSLHLFIGCSPFHFLRNLSSSFKRPMFQILLNRKEINKPLNECGISQYHFNLENALHPQNAI